MIDQIFIYIKMNSQKKNLIKLSSSLVDLEYERTNNIKQHRRWWIRPTNQNRSFLGYHHVIEEMRLVDTEEFFNFHRMSPKSFDKLLALVGPELQKASQREPLSPALRLQVTLRHLATGDSHASLHYLFRIGKSTVQCLIPETCKVLCDTLEPIVLKRPTKNDWIRISAEFYKKWGFPMCCGPVDGKHIRIKAPRKSGSKYFCYKKYFSSVLLAACDANYNFTVVDIGSYGSLNDAGIISQVILGKDMQRNRIDFPDANYLPGTTSKFGFFFIADTLFPLLHNLLVPYKPPRDSLLSLQQRYFNYRLSRARITIENTFGILAARWRIFHKTIDAKPTNVDKIVQATVVLHNFIKAEKGDNIKYAPDNYVDRINAENKLIKGRWRMQMPKNTAFEPIDMNMLKTKKYDQRSKDNRDFLNSYIQQEQRFIKLLN